MVTRPDGDGTSVAYVPANPGYHALGKTPADANSELPTVFDMMVEECARGEGHGHSTDHS